MDEYGQYRDAVLKLNNGDGLCAVPEYYSDPREGESLVDAILRVTGGVPEDAPEEKKQELAEYLLREWYIRPLEKKARKSLGADSCYMDLCARKQQTELMQGKRPDPFNSGEFLQRCLLGEKRLPDNTASENEYEVYTYLIEKRTGVAKVYAGLEEMYTVYYTDRLFSKICADGVPPAPDAAKELFQLEDVSNAMRLVRATVIGQVEEGLVEMTKDAYVLNGVARAVWKHTMWLCGGKEAQEEGYWFLDKKKRLCELEFSPDGQELLYWKVTVPGSTVPPFEMPEMEKHVGKLLKLYGQGFLDMYKEAAEGLRVHLDQCS
jgi:hypothetical protein